MVYNEQCPFSEIELSCLSIQGNAAILMTLVQCESVQFSCSAEI